jgi:uncharacterized protein (DUF362 family)
VDKSDNTIGRRDFIRVIGGTLVATELGIAGCADADPSVAPQSAAPNAVPAVSVPAATPQTASAAGALAPAAPSPAASSSAMAASPNTARPSEGASGPASGSSGSSAAAPVSDAAGAASARPGNPMASAAGSPAMAKPGMAANGKARVYVIKTADRADGIAQALAMFGGLGFVSGRDVVLKPNFNSQNAFPATTHDDTIRTMAAQLKAANAGKITLADSSGATTGSATPTATVIQAKQTVNLCKEIGIDFLSYDEPGVEFETFQFDGMTWSGGLAIPKLMRSDRVKILMPCCKTHTLGDYTMSMKLAAGLPPRSRRGLISDMHTSLHEKVVDINKGFTPDLILMDAMMCFIDGGPDSGTTANPGLIVAATDRVALDAVGVAILKSAGSTSGPIRGKIFATRQIMRAVEIGLGIKSPDEIELIGNDTAIVSKLRSILDVG